MNNNDLKEILEQHNLWLDSVCLEEGLHFQHVHNVFNKGYQNLLKRKKR